MSRVVRALAILLAASSLLAACGGGPSDSVKPPPDVTVNTPFTAETAWDYVQMDSKFICDDINNTQRVDATGIELRHIAVKVGGIWDVTGQCLGTQEGHLRLFKEIHVALRDKDGAISGLGGGAPQFSFIADCDEQPGRCIEKSQ